MTAALDVAAFPPEVLDALAERLAAKLKLVPSPLSTLEEDAARGLSMLLKSIRRRVCERRQADAARGDRIGDRIEGLSTIPASVRRRECERRRVAAKKADSIASRMYLHCEAYEKHATAAPKVGSGGPLAGDVAKISAHSANRKKLELARLYGTIRAGLAEGSKGRITLPRWWAKAASEWEDARKLLANFGLPQIRGAAVSLGETWKPSKEFPRPTVSLVLWRLEVWRDGSRPAKRTDSRRLTGEQLEERDRARARAAASDPRAILPDTATKGPRADGERVASDDGPRTCREDRTEEAHRGAGSNGRSIAPSGQRGSAEGGPPTPAAAANPLQIAEPSPATSAEARAVLDLVNETAARCRAFRGRP